MSFELYVWIANRFFESGNLFAHAYFVLSWNLMCRTNNTERILLQHFLWKNDCFGVLFAKTKTDQESELPKDPKHCYANPLNPSICPVLALGLYFSCNGNVLSNTSQLLFPGGNQSSRFSRMLQETLSSDQGKLECALHGLTPNQLGTHSCRKGSSTFACSRCTAGPSISSVCIRAGWSMGNVQDRYIRFESAGDQYLGRVLAGLPISLSNFQSLPP